MAKPEYGPASGQDDAPQPGASAGAPTGINSDLDALQGLAAKTDADHGGTLPDGTLIADQPAQVNYANEAQATVATIAAMITGYCAPAGELWTDDKQAAVAGALAPVMEKYQFTIGALPCELVLIITAGPLLYQTSKIIATQMAREKAAALAAKKSPGGVADATDKAPAVRPGPVTPEQARHPQTALYP